MKIKTFRDLPRKQNNLGIPLPENKKVIKFPVHAFDRYEIPIQAFLYFINGKLIISDPHIHTHTFPKYVFKKSQKRDGTIEQPCT